MLIKPETFQQNVRGNKDVLKEQAGFITEEIVQRGGATNTFDFRCMIIMAQWLVEQGGYTMTPEGNNPGNTVETGDAGTFTRSYNTEFVNGVRVSRPDVKFAKYSSMTYARKRKFDLLQNNWAVSYQAVLTGAPCDVYTGGLFPGKGKDYATAPKSSYMSGMRFRLNQVVGHFILIAEDDIKECEAMGSAIPSNQPVPSGVSLDYRNSVELNKNMVSVLKLLLTALKDLDKRVRAGGRIQP